MDLRETFLPTADFLTIFFGAVDLRITFFPAADLRTTFFPAADLRTTFLFLRTVVDFFVEEAARRFLGRPNSWRNSDRVSMFVNC